MYKKEKKKVTDFMELLYGKTQQQHSLANQYKKGFAMKRFLLAVFIGGQYHRVDVLHLHTIILTINRECKYGISV